MPGTALRAVGSGTKAADSRSETGGYEHFNSKNIIITRNTCMQQPLALVSKQLYFPNMKYLKIVIFYPFDIFAKKCENNEKIMSFNYKIYNLHSFLVSNTINMLI